MTAAGSMSLAQEALRDILAAAATFQTWVGARDSAAAKEKIFHEALPEPAGETFTAEELAAARPCAVISTDPNAGGFAMDLVATYTYARKGRLLVGLVQSVPADTTRADADMGFRNTIGQICDDLAALAGRSGQLIIQSLQLLRGPERFVHERDTAQGEQMLCELMLEWSELE